MNCVVATLNGDFNTLTDTCAIKHDYSRKTIMEGDQCRQLAVLDCVVFNNNLNGGNKNLGESLAVKTV